MSGTATSPAASGPAGAVFEGQVGAHYLLTQLAGAEPRGLPGANIDRIEFQRASDGHALDDVIIKARDRNGRDAVLEIQVKHAITFAPSDPVFRKVVAQIAAAAGRAEFHATRYELAIATARGSWKINGAYQDVLAWARQLQSAGVFMSRINRRGLANKDMRTFVETFRTNLGAAGSPDDDETVWRLLRRLQILVFDFTAPGSASEALARERSIRLLAPDESHRAPDLWSVLTRIALDHAAAGGELDAPALTRELTTTHTFRLAPDPKRTQVRELIAEATQNALRDIDDTVGGVRISRDGLIELVRGRFETGRYLEIRGEGGVGKSSMLKHFAELVGAECRVLVLTSKRTPAHGWLALRAQLGFEGTARTLLSDLAADGAAFVFVDGLDDFNQDEQRRTIVDLIAAAADIPGVMVLATARNEFGRDEPSWLPETILKTLGMAAPVIIDALSGSEVDELRDADRRLAELLADQHPAQALARNLYRLNRLARQSVDSRAVRTEVDMAMQWWDSADGHRDSEHRERARLLRNLAERALAAASPWDVSGQPAPAIDQLRASGTLREFRHDQVAFKHDVLRDWAVANLLHEDGTQIEKLPLSGPAPVGLNRSLELAARMASERASDDNRWAQLLEHVSASRVHGSWRRAVLLALVRSEAGPRLLALMAPRLLADRAMLLGELIRTALAVDAESARSLWSAAGLNAADVPEHIVVPQGRSWRHLIEWTLTLGENFPYAVLPEIVDLYCAWSTGLFGADPLTPLLLNRLVVWLQEIEAAEDDGPLWGSNAPFQGAVSHDKLRDLEEQLRTGFLMFCHRLPANADAYLASIPQRRQKDRIAEAILTFRGTAAQAAPARLVDVTLSALIHDDAAARRRDWLDDGFSYSDHKLMPASPTQGPFFELLTYAPKEGQRLVWSLVGRAIAHATDGKPPPDDDAIIIELPEGKRRFPWVGTYLWSRGQARSYAVGSALMALEAWAHRRVEAKEPVGVVLKDVLGPPGTPAAVLLIAVDVLLSHWPATRDAAVPFLCSPELLAIEHTRPAQERFSGIDIAVVSALRPAERRGQVTLKELQQRPSRQYSLGALLTMLIAEGQEPWRQKVTEGLTAARQRLGAYAAAATLADPAFMAFHAKNLVDPANYRETEIVGQDGKPLSALQYASPAEERTHLSALQAGRSETSTHLTIELLVSQGLRDDRTLTREEIAASIRHVQTLPSEGGEDSIYAPEMLRLMIAMLAMRDGDAAIKVQHAGWARDVFDEALRAENDFTARLRNGLMHNAKAIAVVGLASLWAANRDEVDCRALLAAASEDAATAHGFASAKSVLGGADARMIQAILRCGLAACIRARRSYEENDERSEAVRAALEQQRASRVADELTWLKNGGAEPAWPIFPDEPRRPRRRGIRLPGSKPDAPAPTVEIEPSATHVDHQAGALWLTALLDRNDPAARALMPVIVEHFAQWTMTLNGAALGRDEEIDGTPHEWNDAYFRVAAHALPHIGVARIEQLIVAPLCGLPDEPFFDALGDFLRNVDVVYFNDNAVADPDSARIRGTFADRLMASRGWRRVSREVSFSIETHIGPAIGVVMFNDYTLTRATCYLHAGAARRLGPFVPKLTEVITGGAPSFFVAHLALNLLEVAPQTALVPLALDAASAWLAAHPGNAKFWIDNGIGQRWISWIEKSAALDADVFREGSENRRRLVTVLDRLVKVGLTSAYRLERSLTAL